MADVHSISVRSYNMSCIKSKHTKPEMLVRSFLHKRGFRFKLHDKALPGKPDIKLSKYKTVIEIFGCFFHRHEGCKYCTTPSNGSRTNWAEKFKGNVERDRQNLIALNHLGWEVIIIWECELKSGKANTTLDNLFSRLVYSKGGKTVSRSQNKIAKLPGKWAA